MMLQKYTQIPLFGFYIEAQIYWLKPSENAEKMQSFFMKYLVFYFIRFAAKGRCEGQQFFIKSQKKKIEF